MKIRLLSLFFFALFCSCARVGVQPAGFWPTPSWINAEKSILDDQRIELRGYLVHEPEWCGVWDSSNAMNIGDASACLSLLYPAELKEKVVRANRKQVRIVGKFRSNVASGPGVRLGLCNYTGVFVESIELDR